MFCKNCGKEVEESAKFCDGCGTNLQGENVFFQNAISKATPIISDCKGISKRFFSKKPDSIIDIAKNNNSKVGILFIIVNVLLFGFVSCFNFSQIINKFTDSFFSELVHFIEEVAGNFVASQLSAIGGLEKVPVLYELFIPFAVISLGIFAVIIGSVYLIIKLKKLPFVPITSVLNCVGIASFPMLIALIFNFIVGFIFPCGTIFIFIFGVLTSLIFYYECNKEIFGNERPIIEISIVFITVLIVLAVAISIGYNMVGEKILDSMSGQLSDTTNEIVEEGISSYFDGLFN